MNAQLCPICGTELGPGENRAGCLTCRALPLSSHQDRIVAVLERSTVALAYWDIRRVMESDSYAHVHSGSLLVWLATDPRTCWGGPGLYGLYRHGILPGVRDLGSAVAVLIHAADAVVSHDQARFLLQHVGYRFRSVSINSALRRAEAQGLLISEPGFGAELLWMPNERRSVGPVLGLRKRDDVDAVLDRAARQAAEAIEQWTAVEGSQRAKSGGVLHDRG